MTPVLLAAALLVGTGSPATRLGRRDPGQRGNRLARVAPALAGLVLLLFFLAGRATVVLSALTVLATAAFLIDRARASRRARNIESATTTVLGLVVADLQSGALLGPSFARAAGSLPDSAPKELERCFTTAAHHISRGGEGHVALAAVPELGAVSRIWALADTHGLPAAPLLEQARARLVARARHRSATTASLQGPQATALILSALPLAGIALGSGMGANPLDFLLSGGVGGFLLLGGVALICGGLLISRALITRASA